MRSLKYFVAFFVVFFANFLSQIEETNAEKLSKEAQSIVEAGYSYEEHTTQTKDGYLLTNYRILGKKKPDSDFYPIVMVHGVQSAAEDFLLLGDRSSPFVFADAGYDVWLMNMRFTATARHATLSRDDPAYWAFSLEEHARYDLPDAVDHVLAETRRPRAIFVGLSAGNMLYVMMCNERPDMNDKIAAYVAFSPAFFLGFFSPLAKVMKLFNGTDPNFTHYENTRDADSYSIFKTICESNKYSQLNLCYSFAFLFFGPDWDEIIWNNTKKLFGRYSAYSRMEYEMIWQISDHGVIAKYDYGPELNLVKYGSKDPPAYRWDVLKAPMILYCGKNDRSALPQDVEKALKLIKTSKASVYVRIPRWKNFNHLDYIASKTVADPLYRDVLAMLPKVIKHESDHRSE